MYSTGVRWLALLVCVGCVKRPADVPPATADQSVSEAMRLVCDAPARAARDRSDGSRADKIAAHLTDGIGNERVLTTVEGWKTDGIVRAELDALVKEAHVTSCALQAEAS